MAIEYIYPNATDANPESGAAFNVVGAATAQEAVDDPVASPDNGTTRIWVTTGGIRLGFSAMPTATSISKVTQYWRAATFGGPGENFTVGVRINGSNYFDPAAPVTLTNIHPNYSTQSVEWTTNPDTSAAWTTSEVNNILGIYRGVSTISSCHYDQVYFEVDYVALPAQIEQARNVASRRLWFGRQPQTTINVRVPLSIGLQFSLHDRVNFSDLAGPHSDYDGWLYKKWQRRTCVIIGRTVNPLAGTCELTLLDMRHFMVLYRDSAWATKNVSAYADGISRIDKGCTRTFSRSTKAYVLTPEGADVAEAGIDNEAHADGGDFQEGSSTNYVIRSSFSAGSSNTFTGWTKAGAGTVTEETDTILWDTNLVTRAPYLLKTSTSDALTFTGTATSSIAANTVVSLSLDHNDQTTGQTGLALKRGVDNKYWSVAASSWGASLVLNPCTLSQDEWDREVISNVDVGGNATTLMAIAGMAEAATSGTATILGHIQIEQKSYATTRIITTTSAETRAASRLLISNDNGTRCWPLEQGAAMWQVIPEWSANDASCQIHTVSYTAHSTDNYEWIYYDGTSGGTRWVYEICTGSTVFRSTINHSSLLASSSHEIAVRRTGSEAELDLTQYTADIFLDGTKGTSVVFGAPPTASSSACNMEIGSATAADTNPFDGQIRMIHTFFHVPTDDEIARGLY